MPLDKKLSTQTAECLCQEDDFNIVGSNFQSLYPALINSSTDNKIIELVPSLFGNHFYASTDGLWVKVIRIIYWVVDLFTGPKWLENRLKITILTTYEAFKKVIAQRVYYQKIYLEDLKAKCLQEKSSYTEEEVEIAKNFLWKFQSEISPLLELSKDKLHTFVENHLPEKADFFDDPEFIEYQKCCKSIKFNDLIKKWIVPNLLEKPTKFKKFAKQIELLLVSYKVTLDELEIALSCIAPFIEKQGNLLKIKAALVREGVPLLEIDDKHQNEFKKNLFINEGYHFIYNNKQFNFGISEKLKFNFNEQVYCTIYNTENFKPIKSVYLVIPPNIYALELHQYLESVKQKYIVEMVPTLFTHPDGKYAIIHRFTEYVQDLPKDTLDKVDIDFGAKWLIKNQVYKPEDCSINNPEKQKRVIEASKTPIAKSKMREVLRAFVKKEQTPFYFKANSIGFFNNEICSLHYFVPSPALDLLTLEKIIFLTCKSFNGTKTLEPEQIAEYQSMVDVLHNNRITNDQLQPFFRACIKIPFKKRFRPLQDIAMRKGLLSEDEIEKCKNIMEHYQVNETDMPYLLTYDEKKKNRSFTPSKATKKLPRVIRRGIKLIRAVQEVLGESQPTKIRKEAYLQHYKKQQFIGRFLKVKVIQADKTIRVSP